MKKLILLFLLLPSVALAGPRGVWDLREKLRDGPGVNNLLKDADHGGLVWLAPPELPDADSVAIFRKRKVGGKCRWDIETANRRLVVLTSTGRANGGREHWRARRLKIEDLAKQCVYVRMVYTIGKDLADQEPQKVKHAFSMNKVFPVRND